METASTPRPRGPRYDPHRPFRLAEDGPIARAIGRRIRDRRRKKGMSQRELAERTGHATQAQICRIEKGGALPSIRSIRPLCRALRMTPNQLLGWEAPDADG